MSLRVVESEVARFLSSDIPEVLCIKGKWGVGKTYGWKKFLRNAKSASRLMLDRYAYVSLFGLNSLDDLRYAIFENTVTGDNIGSNPDPSTFSDLISKDNGRKFSKLAEWAGAVFNRRGVADLLAKSAFLLVRNQIVCLDDLERAGKGLSVTEVFGLTSLLKEERKCKIVLLLNEEELAEKEEFSRQLEKVADQTLMFNISPNEAASIAIVGDDHLQTLVRSRTTELGITNIRVIKQIERLAGRLYDLLRGHEKGLIEDAIATAVLSGWAVHQPKIAPTMSFLRSYNRIRLAISGNNNQPDEEALRYQSLIASYPFTNSTSLDHVIMDGAESGYLIPERVTAAAEEVAKLRSENSGDNEFNEVWENLYHGSLTTDDDVFLDQLVDASLKEASAITSLNINSTVRLLRESGRSRQADLVVNRFVEANAKRGVEFFNIKNHHFIPDSELDPRLQLAFEKQRATFADDRDPVDVVMALVSSRSWGERDVLLLSRQSVDDFVRIFEGLKGDSIRLGIELVLAMGQSAERSSNQIKTTAIQALKKISAKSPLRARKLSRFLSLAGGNEARQVVIAPAEVVDNSASSRVKERTRRSRRLGNKD